MVRGINQAARWCETLHHNQKQEQCGAAAAKRLCKCTVTYLTNLAYLTPCPVQETQEEDDEGTSEDLDGQPQKKGRRLPSIALDSLVGVAMICRLGNEC
jgi:hypothetical protein